MAVNKAFAVKNGLEVSTDLILANADTRRVGVGSTNPQYTLDVNGSIGVSTITVNEDIILEGKVSIGNTTGELGQFLISTGDGVSWSELPQGARFPQTFTATPGQDTFNFTYNPSAGIDVYINGVRLSSTEYSATDGITVVLNIACFGGETVDLVAYSVTGLGVGVTGITGLTILDEGVSVGNDANIVSLNFVGAAITSSISGFGVTITLNDADILNQWSETIDNELYVNTSVGINTDNPQEDLDVYGNINFTGELYQNYQLFVASRWTSGTGDDIYRLSGNIGIGTTNPQYNLDVNGDINFNGSFYQNGSLFVASRWTSGTGDNIYRLSGNVGIGTTDPTRSLDVDGDIRIRGDIHLGSDGNVGTAGSILYSAGSGSGTYWGDPVGSQGIQGTGGIQGFSGTQGSQGVQGLSNQGVQGTEGSQGSAGTQGSQGIQGLSNQGVQGTGGIQGFSGTQGSQGVQGLSNQGVQGSIGIQGDSGTQGTTGSQGSQGVQGFGNQGVQGSIGIQGDSGIQGSQGIQGLSNQGVQGSIGIQGIQGTQGTGSQGTQGVQGLSNQGVQGTQGTFGPATIPQNSQTTSYTLESSDNGKHISITTGGITVPQNIFVSGENVVIFNDSGSNQTITSGIGITMYLAGTASTGDRTILQRGLATILCISDNRFVVSGAGLT